MYPLPCFVCVVGDNTYEQGLLLYKHFMFFLLLTYVSPVNKLSTVTKATVIALLRISFSSLSLFFSHFPDVIHQFQCSSGHSLKCIGNTALETR